MDILIEYYQKFLLGLSGLVLAAICLIGFARGLDCLGRLPKIRLLFRLLVFPRSLVAWICTVPLLCFIFAMGAVKPGGGDGNSTNSPSLPAPLRLLHYIQQAISSNDVERGYRVSEGDQGGIVPMPAGAVTNELLRSRGGYDWAFRVEPGGWRFPYRDGFLDGVTVLARGEVRPDIGSIFFPVPITNGVSLLPEAKWELLPNAGASVFSHSVTDEGSLLLDWHNALVGRDQNCPTNLQMELFRDGSFAWRTDYASQFYLPVFPFDWDNDGLENSVDPEPLIANAVDAHGTNAEWYDIVCSNVFENVGGVTSFKVEVNSNAYYYAEVVAERGPVPVYFNADRVSRLGSPVIVANGGVTNRVPLLVGVEYTVTSTVPISVSASEAMYATVTSNGLCSATVKWPLEFEFVENVGPSNRTYTVIVGPYDPGGEFTWGGSHGGGAMLMSAPPDSSCACYSAMGNIVTFSCSPNCDCNAECEATGEYRYEAAMFAVTGGVCRCGFDDPPPPEEPTDDPLGGPNISIDFSKPVVVYEDEHLDTHGTSRDKRSTRVRLTISANGGPNGAFVMIWQQNYDKLTSVAEGPVTLPMARELAPNETFSETCILEGVDPSDASGDVVVSGFLLDMLTDDRLDDSASLTVVKLKVEADAGYPIEKNRHVFGPKETARIKSTPSGMAVIAGTVPDDIELKSSTTPADLVAGESVESFTLAATVGSELFNIPLSVIHPANRLEIVEVLPLTSSDWNMIKADPLPAGLAGVAGKIKFRLMPDYVSFGKLSMIEGYAEATGIWGCCTDEVLYPPNILGHGADAGGSENDHVNGTPVGIDNTLDFDRVAFWVNSNQTFPCQGGGFTLNIPWKWYAENNVEAHEWMVVPQIFTVTPNGTVSISKNGVTITREIGGRQSWSESE